MWQAETGPALFWRFAVAEYGVSMWGFALFALLRRVVLGLLICPDEGPFIDGAASGWVALVFFTLEAGCPSPSTIRRATAQAPVPCHCVPEGLRRGCVLIPSNGSNHPLALQSWERSHSPSATTWSTSPCLFRRLATSSRCASPSKPLPRRIRASTLLCVPTSTPKLPSKPSMISNGGVPAAAVHERTRLRATCRSSVRRCLQSGGARQCLTGSTRRYAWLRRAGRVPSCAAGCP